MEHNTTWTKLTETRDNVSEQLFTSGRHGFDAGIDGRGFTPVSAFVFGTTNTLALVVGFFANIVALNIIKRCQKMKDFNTSKMTATFLKYLLSLDTVACFIIALQSFGRNYLYLQSAIFFVPILFLGYRFHKHGTYH